MNRRAFLKPFFVLLAVNRLAYVQENLVYVRYNYNQNMFYSLLCHKMKP